MILGTGFSGGVDHQLKTIQGIFHADSAGQWLSGLMEIADHIIKSHNGHVCGNL